MLASRSSGVVRTASEMLTKQQDSPREFGTVMGEIYGHLSVLDDPALQGALQDGDFSLATLTRRPVTKIFLNIPAEFLQIWSPVIRLLMAVAMR